MRVAVIIPLRISFLDFESFREDLQHFSTDALHPRQLRRIAAPVPIPALAIALVELGERTTCDDSFSIELTLSFKLKEHLSTVSPVS